jgi:O-antigen/teichoic acid export membrane protein
MNLTTFGVNAAFNLLVLLILARRLGVEEFGRYCTLFTLMLLAQLVAEAGTTTVLTCRIALAPEKWRQTVAEASGIFMIVVSGSWVGLLALAMAWAGWGEEANTWSLMAWVGLGCAAIHVQRFCAAVFQAFELFQYESFAKVLQSVLFAALVLLLLDRVQDGLTLALALLAISHVVAALYLVASLQRSRRSWAVRLNLALLKDWLTAAGPLGLADVLRRLTWHLDILLLGLLQSPAVVGLYSVACRPLATLNWVPQVLLAATLPSLTRMADRDRAALKRTLAASVRLLWLISLPIAVAIFVYAEPVVMVLAGQEYLEAALPMRVVIWMTTLFFLSGPFRFLFAALGQPRLYALLVILLVALEAACESVLIPVWSYFGACAGGVLGEFVFAAAGFALCRHLGLRGIEWSALARAALAAAVMGGALWAMRGASGGLLLAAVTLSTGFYVVLCILLGAIRQDEVRHCCEALSSFFRAVGRPGETASARRSPRRLPQPDPILVGQENDSESFDNQKLSRS